MLCNFYIVAIAAFLPLYIRGTYVMLGDDKYLLFRSISLLCLGLVAVATAVKQLTRMWGWTDSSDGGVLWKRSRVLQERGDPKNLSWKKILSPRDIWMMLYGAAVIVSALCSIYGEMAWTGYRDWHMGAVSQLIFVGIYFFVSRCYRGDVWPVYLSEGAFFLVTVLGFCSRLGLDPLGLMQGFNSSDWEYSHLISTIGNINWFCGYCAVALAMPVAGYLKGRYLHRTLILYVISTLGLLLLCIQGSDMGLVLTAICLVVCLLWSHGKVTEFGRTLLMAAGVAFGLPCYSLFVRLLGEEAFKSIPADGPGLQLFSWNGWWLIGIVCVGLYFFLRQPSGKTFTESHGMQEAFGGNCSEESPDITFKRMAAVRNLWLGIVILGAAVLAAGGIVYLRRLSGSEAWINGRGALWRLASQGFWRGNWKQKLFGAGPDCFAEYIYSTFAPSELFVQEGYWASAIFANAHNQWLNHLVNMGLLGTGCAVGIAIAAARRYYNFMPGVLALALYGVNSLVSFQQVMSTPLFFVMMGICEYQIQLQDVDDNTSKKDIVGGQENEDMEKGRVSDKNTVFCGCWSADRSSYPSFLDSAL